MVLSARALGKRYGADPGYEAVRNATLDLEPGELVSIVGRSGSGKSTLLAMLGALTRPSAGDVRLDGTDLWSLSEARLADFRCRHIGFVFQFPSLLPNLTAADNVALPALLGRTMAAGAAYARAAELLARVGLAGHANAFPGSLSGGEQRRVVIARALTNSPRILLADEPTSDLDQDTETDIIALLRQLQREELFGFVLVTHNLDLACQAQRSFEMRQGVLAAIDLPAAAASAEPPPRRFGPATVRVGPEPAAPAVSAKTAPIPLGGTLWRGVQKLVLASAAFFALALLADFTVGKYQAAQLRARSARSAALAELALDSLRGEVAGVADLGDGNYELSVDLQNVGGGQPIYVMAPDMRAYVQVAREWQELPIAPEDAAAANVLKIEGRQTYRFRFAARVKDYAQLLPDYMHVRFADTMLVSPDSTPQGDVFERRDNYYVYLKPFDIDDEPILKRVRFPGKPPVWIPMPPH